MEFLTASQRKEKIVDINKKLAKLDIQDTLDREKFLIPYTPEGFRKYTNAREWRLKEIRALKEQRSLLRSQRTADNIARDKYIAELRSKGMPYEMIAKKLGITRERVRQLLAKYYPHLTGPGKVTKEYSKLYQRTYKKCERTECEVVMELLPSSKKRFHTTECRSLAMSAKYGYQGIPQDDEKAYRHFIYEWKKKNRPELLKEYNDRSYTKHRFRYHNEPGYRDRVNAYMKEYWRKRYAKEPGLHERHIQEQRERNRKLFNKKKEVARQVIESLLSATPSGEPPQDKPQ